MLTLHLPPELEQRLAIEAQQQGTTPELLAIDSLQRLYAPIHDTVSEPGGTLAEYWADYIGSIDSSEVVAGGARLSENTGQQFAQLLQEKRDKQMQHAETQVQ